LERLKQGKYNKPHWLRTSGGISHRPLQKKKKMMKKKNRIGHILHRNCLLKQVIEGKIKGEMEVTKRRGRRRKKLLDDLKKRRGYSHLKEEALDRTMWRNRFGGDFEPVVRQNTEWMNYTSCLFIAGRITILTKLISSGFNTVRAVPDI
jgi:hypothetical protein